MDPILPVFLSIYVTSVFKEHPYHKLSLRPNSATGSFQEQHCVQTNLLTLLCRQIFARIHLTSPGQEAGAVGPSLE